MTGLGPSPRKQYLYISTEHSPTGWHRWDHVNESPIPIQETGLYGKLVAIQETEKTYKKDVNKKLRFHINAGPLRYAIETGRYSTFSKGMLASIQELGASGIKKTLCVAPEPSTQEEKVVFAGVYDGTNGKRVYNERWPSDDEDVDELFDEISEFVYIYEPDNSGE